MEIWVVPFLGQGHMLPTMELCKRLALRNLIITLIMSSRDSSSVPVSLQTNPSIHFLYLTSSGPPPPPPPEMSEGHHQPGDHKGMHRAGDNQMVTELEQLINTQMQSSDRILPNCVIVDVMMSWTKQVFSKFEVPVIGFFTSGACSSAMEYAIWKEQLAGELKRGETRILPGLPRELAFSESDLKKRRRGPPGGPDGPPMGSGGSGGPPRGPPGGGALHPPPFHCDYDGKRKAPPELGQQPPWLEETEGSVGQLINTCREQEDPFLDYLADQLKKPVWGVGPLLPDEYWAPAGSILHDQEFRGTRRSSVTEGEVAEWLNRKPNGSVLYVSFGTEVGPKAEELAQLAEALEASDVPFIWAIQESRRFGPPGPHSEPDSQEEEHFLPQGFDKAISDRGIIIRGWAPQLLILRHPSTGGFLSHCGWNSVMEAVAGGIPILAWPIRGDQYFNSDLVVKYLRAGCMINDDTSSMVRKDDIVKGIERLFRNLEVKERAMELRGKFGNGYPQSSEASLDALCNLARSLTR